MAQNLTPAMQQYMAFKKKHNDAILLFRMGDFYEIFFEDAKVASRELGIALTSRNKGRDAIPMCGFPYHALEQYMSKLIAAGLKVAVCDQIQDPAEAKGIVERDVTRVVTAGTLTEDALLDGRSNNFLAGVVGGGKVVGLAWVDLSTGRFEVEETAPESLHDSLARIGPSEILVPEESGGELLRRVPEGTTLTRRPEWEFSGKESYRLLLDHFGTQSLDGFGCEGMETAIAAAGAVISYLRETHKTTLNHILKIEPFLGTRYMQLDQTTQQSLELVRTMRGRKREGSLLGVLDDTVTPMGARLLQLWVLTPLRSPGQIEERLDAVEELMNKTRLRQGLRELLRRVSDIERLTTRISCNRANARDLVSLRQSLEVVPEVADQLRGVRSSALTDLGGGIDGVPEACGAIGAAIVPDPPVNVRQGAVIQDGYSQELDELRYISKHGKNWIAEFEQKEAERTDIPSLKVGYNKVFGYYIEVTHTHTEKVPEHYTRKQTLKNAERYITPELKEFETKVLSAEERGRELEYYLFQQLREEIAAYTQRLQGTARALARLDVLASLAQVAAQKRYRRPEITDGPELQIEEGRHPVLEETMDERFVPNDTHLDGTETKLLIITGPNMAGKSVYIRQTALIALMAQMGSFVPADTARVGVVDRLFTRVGASDEQARGQSTFMVEMIEVANILNNATDKSLIILDEVGRGTSTFDGVSIAWAVSEFIHDRIGARTLFATHYHELAQLAGLLPAVKNYNVAVKEWQDEVIFMHRIVEGSADKSYGIHVARLAGVPREIVQRGRAILEELEASAIDINAKTKKERSRKGPKPRLVQLPLFKPLDAEIRDELLEADLGQMTPAEAIALLEEVQRRLREEE